MASIGISRCRVCGNSELEPVVDLGQQCLTGVFPERTGTVLTHGPLRLLKCFSSDARVCGLVQLEHSYDAHEMFGNNYGYRSGLNPSMVRHLHGKVERIRKSVELRDGDVVVDIGSNDATTLRAYPEDKYRLVGVDPTAEKFRGFYPSHIELIPEFFSADLLARRFPRHRAKVVTSFSMFYDLEAPLAFMREVREVLDDDGAWIFEQSYLPEMLANNSYDTVCHEHLEYYSLRQIKWMTDRVGFRITDLEFNDANGGSFSVTVRKDSAKVRQCSEVERALSNESDMALDSLDPYRAFSERIARTRTELCRFIADTKRRGETVHAIGASTKGNVLLQYCGLTAADVPYVGEINDEKCGRYTPGSNIPIVSEDQVMRMNADYLLILPWHFRKHFVTSPRFSGRRLVFPLPSLKIVDVP